MRRAVWVVAGAILAAVGCSGGGASPSEVVSCSVTLGYVGEDAGSPPYLCAEFSISPDSVVAERKTCEADGNSFKSMPCIRKGVVEGCRIKTKSGRLTTLWFPLPGQADSFCTPAASANGAKVEFLKPDGGLETKPTQFPSVDAGPRVDPVQKCVGNVVATVTDTCKQCLCALDDACRTAVSMDHCDATCWGLIQCIGTQCPNFASMAMTMDYSCLTSKCSQFLSGTTGAQGAGSCVTRCPTECAALESPAGASDGGH